MAESSDPSWRPEVLAPGGSLPAIAAALYHGADAVYVGVGGLNARVRASNLTASELRHIVAAAHAHRRKVYVALNVPMAPATLQEGLRIAAEAWYAGADALIVRDTGLMRLLGRELPGLPLHASTQFGVATPEQAVRARELGCSRAILARECSLEEIRRIHEAVPDLELESFFFGAMCFAVSGACLLGEAVGGRSGNHGHCLQACRLEYFDAAGRNVGRLMSMKDLDYLRRTQELVDAGVVALKIEGRMKSPAWVGCVTRWSVEAARRWREGGLDEAAWNRFDAEVRCLFSRPRTDAFLDGRTQASVVTCPEVSGHAGCPVDFTWRRDAGGPRVDFVTPVPLAIRDGLLLSRRAGGRAQEEPLSIERLEVQGRPVSRSAVGVRVSIPIPDGATVTGVAIHSCKALASAYAGPEDMPLWTGKADQPLRPRWERVALREGELELELGNGRFACAVTEPVSTERARGDGGFGDAHAQRFFPGAAPTETTALYVNPSQVKAARRAAVEALELRYRGAVDDLARRLAAASGETPFPFAPDDGTLLRRGPAGVSRVTDMPFGIFRTSGNDRFRITPRNNGTVVEVAPAEDGEE